MFVLFGGGGAERKNCPLSSNISVRSGTANAFLCQWEGWGLGWGYRVGSGLKPTRNPEIPRRPAGPFLEPGVTDPSSKQLADLDP